MIRHFSDTTCGRIRFDLSQLSHEREVGESVAMLAASGAQAFSCGPNPKAGKSVGGALAAGYREAGGDGHGALCVSVPTDADLGSHSGVARAVEQALNSVGVRRVHGLVLPWALSHWPGELSTTLATLREVSLFKRVFMDTPGLDEARRCLATDGIDGVRLGPGWSRPEKLLSGELPPKALSLDGLLLEAGPQGKSVELTTGAGPELEVALATVHPALVLVVPVGSVLAAEGLATALRSGVRAELAKTLNPA